MLLSKISERKAKKYKLTEKERNFYLQLSFPKVNYVRPIETKYIKRLEGGILEEVNLEKRGGASDV